MSVEAQIAHANRKVNNARKVADQVQKDFDKKKAQLASLNKDLAAVKKAADAAQGTVDFSLGRNVLNYIQRPKERLLRLTHR